MRLDNGTRLTPTHARLLEVLADGKPHKFEELMGLLDDDLSTISALRCHMSTLRTRMRQRGEATIVCEDGCYRQVAYTS